MKYIEGEDRYQKNMLPDNIDDYVDEENPVRVIDAFVDGLDMEILGFWRYEPTETGRPAYDPRVRTGVQAVQATRRLASHRERNMYPSGFMAASATN